VSDQFVCSNKRCFRFYEENENEIVTFPAKEWETQLQLSNFQPRPTLTPRTKGNGLGN